jgi:hypothetical protein
VPQLKAAFEMHVLLAGAPIEGSPVRFECVPGLPDVSKSRYELPSDERLVANKTYTIVVQAVDRCA